MNAISKPLVPQRYLPCKQVESVVKSRRLQSVVNLRYRLSGKRCRSGNNVIEAYSNHTSMGRFYNGVAILHRFLCPPNPVQTNPAQKPRGG
jgi:hypothetical protein